MMAKFNKHTRHNILNETTAGCHTIEDGEDIFRLMRGKEDSGRIAYCTVACVSKLHKLVQLDWPVREKKKMDRKLPVFNHEILE